MIFSVGESESMWVSTASLTMWDAAKEDKFFLVHPDCWVMSCMTRWQQEAGRAVDRTLEGHKGTQTLLTVLWAPPKSLPTATGNSSSVDIPTGRRVPWHSMCIPAALPHPVASSLCMLPMAVVVNVNGSQPVSKHRKLAQICRPGRGLLTHSAIWALALSLVKQKGDYQYLARCVTGLRRHTSLRESKKHGTGDSIEFLRKPQNL